MPRRLGGLLSFLLLRRIFGKFVDPELRYMNISDIHYQKALWAHLNIAIE
jgi:hypothetical protein